MAQHITAQLGMSLSCADLFYPHTAQYSRYNNHTIKNLIQSFVKKRKKTFRCEFFIELDDYMMTDCQTDKSTAALISHCDREKGK